MAEIRTEGAADGDPNVTMTTCSDELSEDYSVTAVPVWAKANGNGKKIKINANLDDALAIQEPYEKVKVYVLNDLVETSESMPVAVQIMYKRGFAKKFK